MPWIIRLVGFVVIFYLLPVGCMFAQHKVSSLNEPWWELRRDSSEQAPTNAGEAVVQIYAARAARWRGVFGVHTWVTTKRLNEDHYTRLEVIGYSVYWGHDAVKIRRGNPDGYWFGNKPTLMRDVRGGQEVEALIDRLHDAARNYPYNNTYHVWPGPNSNTFIAHLGRAVPELKLDLPPNAVGKDYLPWQRPVNRTPSGTGVQLSLSGYGGLLLGLEEGIELNLLGLTAGIDLYPPAVKLPAIGRVGLSGYRRIDESSLR